MSRAEKGTETQRNKWNICLLKLRKPYSCKAFSKCFCAWNCVYFSIQKLAWDTKIITSYGFLNKT